MVWTLLLWGCFGGGETPEKKPDGPLAVTPAAPITHPGVAPQPAAPPGPDEPPLAMTRDNCQDLQHGGPVSGPDCVTQRVKCGDVIYGHTLGGTQVFDTKFYERHKCTPATTDHDGGDERVYLFEFPDGDHSAWVWLDSPCADLDLAAIRVPDGVEGCPTLEHGIRQCEMWPKPGNRREKVLMVSQGGSKWLLVVEGKGKEEGAFSLTIQCKPGLMGK